MELDFDYARACHPDKTKVLGRVLCDLTAGHLVLLHRVRSPYLFGANQSSLANFLEAVEICSRPYAQAVNALWIGNTMGMRMRARWWAIVEAVRPGYVEEQSQAFEKYLANAQKDPRGIFKPVGCSKTFAPLIVLLFNDLAAQYSWDELLNAPFRKLLFERWQLLVKDDGKKFSWPWHLRAPKEESLNGQ